MRWKFFKVFVAYTLMSTVYRRSHAADQDEDILDSPDYDKLEFGAIVWDPSEAKYTLLIDFSANSPGTWYYGWSAAYMMMTMKNVPEIFFCQTSRPQQELMSISGMSGAPFEAKTVSMVLVWKEELEHAAAALLRVTLLSEGYSLEGIKMRNELKGPPTLANNSLTVIVNLVPRLHVRFASQPANNTECFINASNWSFYENGSTLQECAFVEPVTNKHKIDIYILKEYKHAVGLIKNLTLAPTVQLRFTFIERTELMNFISKSNNSFLFLDADRGSYTSDNVKTIQVPLRAPGKVYYALNFNRTVALTVLGEMPPKLSKILEIFSPKLEDLISVIMLDARDNLPEAACKWAKLQLLLIHKWRPAVSNSMKEWVAVVLPREENSLKEYLHLVKLLHATNTFPLRLKVDVFFAPRFDSQWVFRMLIKWASKKNMPQLRGVVLSNDVAAEVGLLADKLNIPLFTYDVSSKPCEGLRIVTATGRQTHLELALRRLFADCGWHRLAVLSEPLRLYVGLTDALRAPSTGLMIREIRIKRNLQTILQGLKEANVRVILVNTGATMASVVLKIAQSLNMTRDAGFLWIVREYNAADNATAIVRPLSVSFWWRGDETDEAEIVRDVAINIEKTPSNTMEETDKINRERLETLRMLMEERWRGRAWPLHAAPLVDALLSLAAGLARTPQHTNDIRFSWYELKASKISGLIQELVYDEDGVKAPLVFVEEWGADPRPHRLATWRGGEWSASGERCPISNPPSDGSIVCLKPEGDPFQPTCRDAVWITSITSIVFVTAAVISLVAWGSRRVLASRERRLKTEFAKRLLTRRERIFAELAEHLVERVDLELQQDLGTGRFGCVRLGVLRERKRKRGTIIVAAKALREDAAPAEESEFLKEACVLALLDHEHIVRFVGVCVVDGPPLLLMEHAFFGDLLSYLQTRRHLAVGGKSTETTPDLVVGLEEKAFVSAEALTRLAREATAALAYLAQRSLVHRDVRASNCLVDERRSLKLADFGLARTTGTDDGEYACSRRGLFPVLWMAPESLASGVSSASSDVWAFGVLVFELVTLGQRPYGAMPPPSVLQHVVGGGRPQLPWDVGVETRALLRACWQRGPEARPQATQLQRWLGQRRRALRPALATELMDVDNEIFGDSGIDEPDLCPDNTIIPGSSTMSK